MAKKTKRTGAAKTTRKSSRSSGKRDLVRGRKTSAYAKRTAAGQFDEMDDVGRSQRTDKRRRQRGRFGAATGIRATPHPEREGVSSRAFLRDGASGPLREPAADEGRESVGIRQTKGWS